MARRILACRLPLALVLGVVAAWLTWTAPALASTEPLEAHGVGALDGDDARVRAELLVDVDSVGPGETFRVGVLLGIDPDWHVYWRNSGDAGFPTEVDFASADVDFAPLQYPAPEVFLESGGLATTFGYTNEVLLIAEARKRTGADTSTTISADVQFLVCKVLCIPGQIKLEAIVATRSGTTPTNSAAARLFDRYSKRMPGNARDLGLIIEGQFSSDSISSGDAFELEIAVAPNSTQQSPERVVFVTSPRQFAFDIPASIELETLGTRAHPSAENRAGLVVRGRVLQGQQPPEKIAGVLGLRIDGKRHFVSVSFALPGSGSAIARSESAEAPAGSPQSIVPPTDPTNPAAPTGMTLWVALAFGLIGGLILNLMPCVLPILALKAFRIVESGGRGAAHLRRQGLSFALGTMFTMALLAAVVVGLRATGEWVGWGFQFQQPSYLAFMAVLLSGFALNLFGVFEINVNFGALGRSGDGYGATAQSFFDGLLAVLLATPCSAPFLGTAVGFAFSSSAITIGAIFLSIGLGLALPYLVISFIPGLASKLPGPGRWMDQLRSVLGFALLTTVLWLLWITGQSTSAGGLIWLLALLLSLCFGLWAFGQFQRSSQPRSAAAVALLLLVGLAGGLIHQPVEAEGRSAPLHETTIRRWDPEAIQETVEGGRIAFVDFTADWCLTCKVNERLVLSSDEVRDAMQRLGVVRFRADWTRPDDAIRAELQHHGRAGVPMYLVFYPDAPNAPRLLPEIITIDTLVAALHSTRHQSDGAGRSE